jgi:L-lactate dehydrogenase complex protein LldG
MSARDRILAKLKATAPAENRPEPDVASWFAGHRRVESPAEKAARFRSLIELAHAEVYAVSSANWLQKLWEVLTAKGLAELLVSPNTDHGQRALQQLSRVASTAGLRPADRSVER